MLSCEPFRLKPKPNIRSPLLMRAEVDIKDSVDNPFCDS